MPEVPNVSPNLPQPPEEPKKPESKKDQHHYFHAPQPFPTMVMNQKQAQQAWQTLIMQSNSAIRGYMNRMRTAQQNIRKSIEGEY